MKRPPVLFAAAFSAALALCPLFDRALTRAFVFVLLFGMAAAFLSELERLKKLLPAFMGGAIGLVLFTLWTGAFYAPAIAFDDAVCRVDGYISSPIEKGEDGLLSFTVTANRIESGERVLSRPVKLRISTLYDGGLSPFDSVHFTARLTKLAKAPFDGAFSARDYYKAKGIYLRGFAEKSLLSVTGTEKGHTLARGGLFLRDVITRGAYSLKEPYGSLCAAFLLGDKSMLDRGISDMFAIAGVSHIMAVSGMHLSMAAGLLLTLSSFFGISKKKSWLLCALLALIYMAAAVFSPSIMRAGIMYIVMALAVLLERDYDSLSALSVAACLILAANPFAIYDTGFLLSVLATLGIIILGAPAAKFLESRLNISKASAGGHIAGAICGTVAVSASSMAFTLPVIMAVFNRVPVLWLFSNMLIVPMLPLYFIACLGASLLSGVYFAGGALGLLCTILGEYILIICRLIAGLPFSVLEVYSVSYVIWGIYALLVLLCTVFVAKKEDRRILGPILIALALCAVMLMPTGHIEPGQMVVSFIDVGQGEAGYIETEDKNMLIDCGSSTKNLDAGERVAKYIKQRGRLSLDYLVISHFHDDHADGVERLMAELEVKNLIIMPPDQSDLCEEILFAAEKEGSAVTVMKKDGDIILSPAVAVRVFVEHIGDLMEGDNQNERNLAVRVKCGLSSFLFTGDMEREGERRLSSHASIRSDVLKVGHHGSNTSTSFVFLEAVRPKIGVISCAAGNSYGHPHREVIDRLDDEGVRILRTDKMGTVVIFADSRGNIEVKKG